MSFGNELNNYLELLDCTPKDICNVSGLSPTIISRYINDKRTPRVDSEYFNKLVNAIYKIANDKNISIKKKEISEHLANSMMSNVINYDDFIANLNVLFLELKINTSDLAKSLGYDTSFISKIKNKSRKPSDLDNFVDSICSYIATTYKSEERKAIVSTILKCSTSSLKDFDVYKNNVKTWITSPHASNDKVLKNFLNKLDQFDLNAYIKTDVNKAKLITTPIVLRNSKTFYGKSRA